ncbi:MAG: hypothetical protein HYW85_07440 [Deltaproteobacteria bacterium]|nr:hypothetical protein [Deltaproteobacteria bacterium]
MKITKQLIIGMGLLLSAQAFSGIGAGNGGDTYTILLQEAKLKAIEYIEKVDKGAFSKLDISERSKEIFLGNYTAYLRESKNINFLIVIPSLGDEPLIVAREGKSYRVEALYDSSAQKLKIDKDLTEDYDHEKLAKLLLHEAGHMVGFGFEFENNLDEIAVGIIRSFGTSSGENPKPKNTVCINDPSMDLREAPIGFTCITENDAVFERVKRKFFGEAWKDHDTGLIWSDLVGETWGCNKGVKVCETLEARLPTQIEVQRASASGLLKALPNVHVMKRDYSLRSYWWYNPPTRSWFSHPSCGTYSDTTISGNYYEFTWNDHESVRCVVSE